MVPLSLSLGDHRNLQVDDGDLTSREQLHNAHDRHDAAIATAAATAGDGVADRFGLTVEQLLEIQAEADVTKLNDMGGVSVMQGHASAGLEWRGAMSVL